MNKYALISLVGVIVLLAAALIGTLVFMQNRPVESRAIQTIYDVAPMEPNSELWGRNFPNQYSSFLDTGDNTVDTTYGGSSKFSHLERDPRQVILFASYGFSLEYNDDRGHENALTDVREIKRVNEKTPGTCYSCKSSDNPGLWAEMGMEAYDKTLFSELGKHINNPIGCANCHEAETMRLIVTNPALEEALEAQGKDWRTFSRQEMRSLVCANCHVEYYFKGDGKYLTFPWQNGTKVEEMYEYYTEVGFKDWEYPEALTPMLKAQHPEYEMFTAGSTHFNAGVACADCHMPYVRDGAAKYTDHNIRSPLLQAERACGQCHTDVDYVTGRVSLIQDQAYNTKIATEDAIVDAINAIKAATANPASDQALLVEARELHRQAQFYWDFVSAENSMGFHNPEYVLKILAESTNLARQAQMKASQAANDPSLLEIDTYYLDQEAGALAP
ncbi:MAG: ammonia-forming cytochrome c nitrite reductase subunit c552 [Chloroflexi bacterium HGW-Chloroflexi-6]|nr:MAG: ammonia-forming cytochrome c nitrite reductase subunit c552 [Chloroflexi bacterium HGW-Chloroflexi-6]